MGIDRHTGQQKDLQVHARQKKEVQRYMRQQKDIRSIRGNRRI